MTWPQFVIPQPLGGTRSWTASFDSYDQYRENGYYCIRLFDGTQLVGEIMAQVDTTWIQDHERPGALDPLYDMVAAVAADGVTNTTWRGCYGLDPNDPFTGLARDPFAALVVDETSSETARWILRHSRIPDHGIWQYEVIERWTNRVVRRYASWSNAVTAVRWDGDLLVVTAVDGTEQRLAPA